MLFSGPAKLSQPPELALSCGDLDTPSNTWFIRHQDYRSIGISIDSAVFARLTNVTNRQTHAHTPKGHATPSVAIGRIAVAAMWSKNRHPLRNTMAER